MSAILSALGLGLLLCIQPCPLAINLAAVAALGSSGGGWRVLMVFLVTRLLGYLVLALLAMHLLAAEAWPWQLGGQLMGPALILLGMVQTGLLPRPRWWRPLRMSIQHQGTGPAIAIGLVSVIALCPASAALFLLVLIPMAVEHGQVLILAFAIGASLPILALAWLVAGPCCQRTLTGLRLAGGAALIALGLYQSLMVLMAA